MAFFGGFLKFIGMLVLIAGSVLTGVVCFDQPYMDVFLLMGSIWLGFFCVALVMWGAGTALSQVSQLKKRLDLLERRLYTPVSESGSEENRAWHTPRYARQTQATSPWKIWVSVILIGLLVLALIGVLVFLLMSKPAQEVPEAQVEAPYAEAPAATMAPMEIAPVPAETAAVEAPPAAAPAAGDAVRLGMGETASTGFMNMHFSEMIVNEDIKYSVTIGRATHITGPQPVSGQKYVCLTGTITNTSNAPLPVYDFFLGQFNIDGYTYEVSANDCDILNGEGRSVSEIDPLMEYTFRIYTAIPNTLADSFSSCVFTFGFYDGFDNHELSHNRAFTDNPIQLCPYQFTIQAR